MRRSAISDTDSGLPKLLKRSKCAELLGVWPETITRMVQDGRFPDPVISSHGLVRWNPDHIDRFLKTGKVR